MGNMREISIEECNAVFGGTDEPDEIVVKARKKVNSSDDGGTGSMWLSLIGGGGGGYVDLASLLSDFFNAEDGEVDEGDDDGDGILNRDEEIVVNGAKRIGFFDIGGGYWGLVGGLTFGSDGTLGVFTGLGLPGLQLGTGNEVSGQLPTGWDPGSPPTVVYRTGNVLSGSDPAEPLPAKEGHYYREGWGPFGGAYYPIRK